MMIKRQDQIVEKIGELKSSQKKDNIAMCGMIKEIKTEM